MITTFDVIHDAVDPLGLLKSIHTGLKDDGIYVCLDINCQDDPADNEGPLAAAFYGFSVFYCMTTSLAHHGAALGTCGLPEAKLRELCAEAGFSDVRRLPLENPFNNVYEVRAVGGGTTGDANAPSAIAVAGSVPATRTRPSARKASDARDRGEAP